MAWCKLIWFSNAIPRCAFISWLAIRDRLSIKERLATRGIGNDTLCVMCSNAVENRDNLLFECYFTQRIWRRIKHWCHQDNIGHDWANIVDWAEKNWSVKSMKAVCSKLGFSAAIYHIWEHFFFLFEKHHIWEHRMLLSSKVWLELRIRLWISSESKLSFRFREESFMLVFNINQELCYHWGFVDSVLMRSS